MKFLIIHLHNEFNIIPAMSWIAWWTEKRNYGDKMYLYTSYLLKTRFNIKLQISVGAMSCFILFLLIKIGLSNSSTLVRPWDPLISEASRGITSIRVRNPNFFLNTFSAIRGIINIFFGRVRMKRMRDISWSEVVLWSIWHIKI